MCTKIFSSSVKILNYIHCSSLALTNPIYFAEFHQYTPLLAGHSKWANIKHIKSEKDGERATAFTRLTRQIRMSIQEGGSSNPAINAALKNVIDIALKKNMPMSSIQNTIKKVENNKNQIKEYQIEIKALNKIYIVCVLYTDNFAMLKMNLAPILKKAKANFVDGRHLFEDMGVIEAITNLNLKNKADIEEICTDDGIEVGAEEVEIIDEENGIVNFLCSPMELSKISKNLTDKGYQIESAEHVFIPKSTVSISNSDLKIYELLKEKILAIEGVERIYDNLGSSLGS